MNKYHQEILGEIKKKSEATKPTTWGPEYHGNAHPTYHLSVPFKREIIRSFIGSHSELSNEDYYSLLDSLYSGESSEEKTMAGLLLGYLPKVRQEVDLKRFDLWLGELVGWGEVDSTCQSNFKVVEILKRWDEWHGFIFNLSKDSNINKRRASLVLLTGPVYDKKSEQKVADLAFEVIDGLKGEKEILITKAISWLLRSLVDWDKKQVKDYLGKNESSLPKIVVRETRRKIQTGKK